MAFSLIREDSRPWFERGDVADSTRAVKLLRDDYERWSRLGMGLVGFVGIMAGGFIAVGMIFAIVELGGPLAIIDVVVTVLGLVVLAASAYLLVRLWQTGRTLTTAAARWMRAPYVNGARQRAAAGWMTARTINLEPRVLTRIVTATLALLLAIAGVSVAIRDIIDGAFIDMSAVALMIGVVSLLCGLGQLGGVMRLVSGASEADPLWVRIRSAMMRD
ncbi:hypothetical protein ACWPKO_24815 (plasmid) [Coraliomargarita sp. W4R53]